MPSVRDRSMRRACRALAEPMESRTLPFALWSAGLEGLSREAREKLARWRPATGGQASRVAGISETDVAELRVHARGVGESR